MPGIIVHVALADGVLRQWRLAGAPASFSPHDPAVVRAFLCGAVAPDMGYYPGGVRLVSDLAHRAASADLARALIRSAANPLQHAFAWGWVTHVMGDLALHPAINQTTAMLLRRVDGVPEPADAPVAHLRVEMTLDACFLPRYGALARQLLRSGGPSFDAEYVAGAYHECFGAAVSARELARCRSALFAVAPVLIGALALGLEARARLQRGMAGFTRVAHVVRPPTFLPVLTRRAAELLRGFPSRFQEQFVSGLRHLENHDLDIGLA
jgi:hypothetical protein